MLRFEDLIAGALGCRTPACSANRRSADAPHCIIYTSGTESRPKGCLHTLNTITFTVHALGGQAMAMGPGDVMFMPSPITHATGLAMGVIAPLMLGAGIHLMDVWEAEAALRRIAEHRCTMSMTAAPFVQMTLDRLLGDPASAARLATMRCWACAGAPIPEVMLRGWSQQVPGCALLPVYGRTGGPAGHSRARPVIRPSTDELSHQLRPGGPRGRARWLSDAGPAGTPAARPATEGEIRHRAPGRDARLLAGSGGSPPRRSATDGVAALRRPRPPRRGRATCGSPAGSRT